MLSVLSMTLKRAVEWQVIEHMPCTVRLLEVPQGALGFYDRAPANSLRENSERRLASMEGIESKNGDFANTLMACDFWR